MSRSQRFSPKSWKIHIGIIPKHRRVGDKSVTFHGSGEKTKSHPRGGLGGFCRETDNEAPVLPKRCHGNPRDAGMDGKCHPWGQRGDSCCLGAPGREGVQVR